MEIKILGIDPGQATTGWALLEGDLTTEIIYLRHYGVIKTKKWRNPAKTEEIPDRERIDQIGRDIQKIVAEYEPNYIVVEDFVFFGNRGKTTSTMPALIENIRMLCKSLGYEAIIYSNGFWKKILLKNHRANKNQVQHYIHQALRLSSKTWDEQDKGGHIRDAAAVALTEWKFITERHKQPKAKPKTNVKPRNLALKWS